MSNENLSKTLDEAEWSWLKPHLDRDAVIIVTPGVDLLRVGHALASDSAAQVQEWIQTKQLSKPTPEQVAEWDKTPTKRFMSLVIQPYVLIQEILHH